MSRSSRTKLTRENQRATWRAARVGDDVWVERTVDKVATTRFRVAVVAGRPAILECRILAAQGPDGLDASGLRDAVATKGAIDAAEPLLEDDLTSSWHRRLHHASAATPEATDAELVLATIGYVAAIDAGSRRPIVEVAEAMGIHPRRVKRHIEQARGRALLSQPTDQRPEHGHWRGIPGGRLLPLGDEEFGRLLARRLGVHPEGLIESRVSGAPGTASRLLEFLAQSPPDGPLRESAAVEIGADGVRELSPDQFLGPWRTLPDGSQVRVGSR